MFEPPALDAFRQSVRDWLEHNCPQTMRTPMPDDEIVWGGRNAQFKHAEAELRTTRSWLRSKANAIEGGTSEVQLNIIAKRVLGLPD